MYQSQPFPVRFPATASELPAGDRVTDESRPVFDDPCYRGSGKLMGRAALITGGDSGIGRAAAIAFAKEGAEVAVAYLNEQKDAEDTKQYIEEMGGNCFLLHGDIRQECTCRQIVRETAKNSERSIYS